jgi:hypothetical protein
MLYAKFYMRDWMEGTEHMARVDREAYMALILEMFRTNGPIQLRGEAAGKILHCSRSNAYALLGRLMELGKIARTPDGHYFNVRAMWEIGLFWEAQRRKVRMQFLAKTVLKIGQRAQQYQRVNTHIERRYKTDFSTISTASRRRPRNPGKTVSPIISKDLEQANAIMEQKRIAEWAARHTRTVGGANG